MKTRVTKELKFEAAHRLLDYQGACANIHGHSYRVQVTLEGEVGLNGMLCDFKQIKQVFQEWIDKYWDHALILNAEDPLVKCIIDFGIKYYCFPCNPTAENMCMKLWDEFKIMDQQDLYLQSIKVWETETSLAEVCR